ncbi:phosphotransferase [Streptomyces sp. 549]|uniref:phosphotransferase n=1 Tax=Streptomyces sp. 549 TaxID=3049076 RepID=UPI0024C3E12D|nr:phosphotransferase [Streptomyces sp. 549]MDK1473442.1 phosphotransferase [Streptomyces sp. 549]
MSTDAATLESLAALAGVPGGRAPEVLADRPDGTVVRCGPVAVKVHDGRSDLVRLAQRLRIAAHPLLRGVLLAPLPLPMAAAVPAQPSPGPAFGAGQPPRAGAGLLGALPDGRAVSRWPYGVPVAPDAPEEAPWVPAGRLLARLHAVPVHRLPGPVPVSRGPAKAAGAVLRMRRSAAASRYREPVERVWAGLPGWARGAPEAARPGPDATLSHGDLHLGQLVRLPATQDGWRLIDVDDLGRGVPAWDLARPAAWFAAGLLDPDDWSAFTGAYRAAGGAALPPGDDPWAVLDVPARALTAQTAATGLLRALAEDRPPDEVEQALLDACLRIARIAPAGPP